MYENDLNAKSKCPLSAGELAGLHETWLKYGKLPWKSLFQPAITLAKQGFIVAPYLSHSISSCANKILSDPGLKQIFAPNGKLKAGDACYNVELGVTLEAVAEEGVGVFYSCRVGKKLVKDVKERGGILSIEDLEEYKVVVTDAVAVDVMGYTILGMPPPSSGTLGLSRWSKYGQKVVKGNPHPRFEEDVWTENAKYLDGKPLVMLAATCHWFYKIMEDSICKFAVLRDLQVPEPDDMAFK